MRRAAAVVAAAGLVGAAGAEAQEPPASAPPAAGTTGPSGPSGPTGPAAGVAATPEGRAAARRERERAARRERDRAADDARAAARRAAARARTSAGRAARAARAKDERARRAGGSSGPEAVLGPAPLGAALSGEGLERFRIPPFLLSIYQAAALEHGIRWEVLAAINEIETDYGRNLAVSSAGARGWMQFMPATWRAYGTDANGDGRRDPDNPVDAIFSAARYLEAAGYAQDVRGALWAYNHADWYVSSVLERAALLAALPGELIGSLTGLAEGRSPVRARGGVPAPRPGRRHLDVPARAGAPVVAVHDGRVVRTGRSRALGRFVELRDVHGNRYTYAHLGAVARRLAAPPAATGAPAGPRVPAGLGAGLPLLAARPAGPRRPADEPATLDPDARPVPAAARAAGRPDASAQAPASAVGPADSELRQNLVAARAAGVAPAAVPEAGRPAVATRRAAAALVVSPVGAAPRQIAAATASPVAAPAARDTTPASGSRRLEAGSTVVAGTVLGRVGTRQDPHLRFRIRPAGARAPLIDPAPVLAGWRLLAASGATRDAQRGSAGRILLASKQQLVRRVLSTPGIELYPCGRRDVAAGVVDRRVLAALAYLAAEGLDPTVSSLRCGHGRLTASGNVSEHTTGSAVDIAAINGVPVLGHQGPGSLTEQVVRKLVRLEGAMTPHQVISLLTVPGAENALAMADHADHVHVGWRPRPDGGTPGIGGRVRAADWTRIVRRLAAIENPRVSRRPSAGALPAPQRREP